MLFRFLFSPINYGCLIFLGVSLKVLLKKHDLLDDEENVRFQWFFILSITTTVSSFITQALTHTGIHEIIYRDHSETARAQKGHENIHWGRIGFTILYAFSPMSFLLLGTTSHSSTSVLVGALGIFFVIMIIGQIEHKVFDLGSQLEAADRANWAANVEAKATGTVNLSGRIIARRASATFDDEEQDNDIHQQVEGVKDKVGLMLEFLRQKTYEIGGEVDTAEVLRDHASDAAGLLNSVRELEEFTVLIRRQLEQIVPHGEDVIQDSQNVQKK